MKRIVTLAMMFLLFGAFSFNANAQEKKTGKVEQKSEDWSMVIKNYEQAVDQCVALYKTIQNGKDDKATLAEFNTSLTNVETIGTKIEKSLAQISRSLVARYNKAKQKLSVVYTKN